MVKAPEDAPRALDLVPSTPEFDAGADALIALIALRPQGLDWRFPSWKTARTAAA